MRHPEFCTILTIFGKHAHVSKIRFSKYLVLAALGGSVACTSASSPDVSEIIPTIPPTIFGQQSINLTSTSASFNLSGSCDPKTKHLQYSLDSGTTWVDSGIQCPSSGHYTVNVPSLSTETVWLRSITQWSFTTWAIANITVYPPTTTPVLQFVTAGASEPWTNPTNMTFTMPSTWTGSRSSTIGLFNMDLHQTGSGFYAP